MPQSPVQTGSPKACSRPCSGSRSRGGWAAARAETVLEGKSVAVVVPAYNEEPLIGTTVSGIPAFVDKVFVVDDASRDGTRERVHALADRRVQLIEHRRNEGVGAAIVSA